MTSYRSTQNEVLDLIKIAHRVAAKGHDDLCEEILGAARGIRGKSLMGSMPSNNVMSDLTNLMQDMKISFAVIGGIALIVHGQVRNTEDIDVLVDAMPPADKTRDQEYMDKFRFYRKTSSTGSVITLDHKQMGGVELLLADDPLRQWALSTASTESVLGAQVNVVSAAALIGLKIRAMMNNPSRASKDAPDILSVWMKSKPDLSGMIGFLSPGEIAGLERVIGEKLTEKLES